MCKSVRKMYFDPRYISAISVSHENCCFTWPFKVRSKLNRTKAPGLNLLSESIFRPGATSVSKALSTLFSKSFVSGEFPSCLWSSHAIPVNMKGSRQQKSNYRSASLLSNFFFQKHRGDSFIINVLTPQLNFLTYFLFQATLFNQQSISTTYSRGIP